MAKQLNTLKKGSNLFKFYSFADRISTVNLDIFRTSAHLDKVQAPLETNETYFLRELEGFKLSADASFRHLYYAIRPWSVSLPMILLHLKDIIKTLLRFMGQAKPEVVPAVLSLLGILSRDMRSEFYIYFDIVLQCFTEKIDEWRTMPEQLEALFTTIAKQFKYLEKFLVKDIHNVFLLYKAFFLTRKEHVRQFAAESFAYLLRKLSFSKLDKMIDFMLAQIPVASGADTDETQQAELADGIGFLLFYAVQGIKGKLTTSSTEIVPLYFSKLSLATHTEIESDADDDEEDSSSYPTMKLDVEAKATDSSESTLFDRYLVLKRFVKSTREHFHHDDLPLIWQAMIQLIKSLVTPTTTSLSRDQFKTIGYAFTLADQWIKKRHLPGMTAESQKSVLENGLQLLGLLFVAPNALSTSPSPAVPHGHKHTQESLERVTVDFSSTLFEMISNEHSPAATELARKVARNSLDRLFSLLEPHPIIAYRFTLSLKDTSIFKHYLLPLTLQFLDKQLSKIPRSSSDSGASDMHPNAREAMWFTYSLLVDLDWGSMIGAAHLNIATESIQIPSPNLALHCHRTVQFFQEQLQAPSLKATINLENTWMAIRALGMIHIQSTETVAEVDQTLQELTTLLFSSDTTSSATNTTPSKKSKATPSKKTPPTALSTLRDNTRQFLIGTILTTRNKLAKICASKAEELAVSILTQSITDALNIIDTLCTTSTLSSTHWLIIQGVSDLIELAISQPYGNASRYEAAKKLLRSEQSKLSTLLEQVAELTSHFHVMMRRSAWNLLRGLALLGLDLPIRADLARLCQSISNTKFDPLQHRQISSQFTDVVDAAMHSAATAFDRSIAIRFLIGMLFVQLTPLWPPAINALNRLHDVDTKTFWKVCLPLIISTQSEIGKDSSSLPDDFSDGDINSKADQMDEDNNSEPDNGDETYLEHQHTDTIEAAYEDASSDAWRFTGASSFSESLWSSLNYAAKAVNPSSPTATTIIDQFIKFIEDHFPFLDDPSRLHIFSQSPASLPSATPSSTTEVATKSTRSSTTKKSTKKDTKESDDDDDEMPDLEPATPNRLSKTAVGEIRKFLLQFLKFIGAFKNTVGMKKSEPVFKILTHLIGIANTDIQLACVQCLCVFKDVEYIIPYKAQLETLIQDNRVRTPLTEFPLLKTKSSLLPQHRLLIIPLITRLLYPKLAHSNFDAGRRGAVLAYLAQCDAEELETLFEITLGPYIQCIEPLLPSSTSQTPSKKSKSKSKVDVVKVDALEVPSTMRLPQLLGASKMISDMVKSMGVATQSYLPKLITISLWLLHHVQGVLKDRLSSLQPFELKQAQQLRKLCMRNLNAVMSFFDAYSYSPYESEIIRLLLVEADGLMEASFIPPNTPFLQWANTISARPRLIPFLPKFLPHVINLLKRESITMEARNILFSIIENLLKVRAEVDPVVSAPKSGYNPGEIIAGLTPKQRSKMSYDELQKHIAEHEIAGEYRAQEDVLLPFSNDLLDAMQVRMLNDYDFKKKIGKRELNILEQLCRFATTSQHADKLASLLMPLTKQKGFNPENRLRILNLFSGMVPLMTSALTHLELVRHLFLIVHDLPSRVALVRVFSQLANLDPELLEIAPLIESLNSVSKTRVNEPDYERRMEAYTQLNEKLLHTLSPRPTSFIVANYLSFVPHDDLSVRNNASFGLTQVIKRIAGQLSADHPQSTPSKKSSKKRNVEPLPIQMVTETMMSEVKRHLNSNSELARREFLGLLSSIVTHLPTLFEDLVPALGQDEDSNFFLCIHHIQTHRRSRALNKLASLITQGTFSKPNLLQIFFPVVKQLVLGASHKEHAVVDEAIKVTTAITARLDWKPFYSIIQACLQGMEKNKTIQNQWIKLLCSVLDTFHFDISKSYEDLVLENKPKKKSFKVVSKHNEFDEEAYEAHMEQAAMEAAMDDDDENEGATTDDEGAPSEDKAENGEDEGEGATTDDEEDSAAETEDPSDEEKEGRMEVDPLPIELKPKYEAEDLLQRQIQRTVVRSVIPTLVRLMKTGDEKDEKSLLRSNVVICAVRLLNRMPESMSSAHVSRFIIEVTYQLASRAFANRLAANTTIQEILKVLGPGKFLYILDILTAQLRRGFQLHILCSIVHTLLKALQPLVQPGDIDEGLHMLNKIFFQELLGQMAEQKKLKKITSATQEATKTHAYDSFGIVAQLIDFDKSVRILVDPLFDVILATTDTKVIKKMRQALDQISVGLRSNSSVTPEKLCIFVYQLVHQYSQTKVIEKEEELTDYEKTWIVADNPYKEGSYGAALKVTGKEMNNDNVIVAYALQILFSLVKASRMNPNNPQHLAMLDPFVPILARNLRSRKDDIVMISLRCLTALLKFPLPSIEGRSGMLMEAAIHLLKKANLQSELLKMCFKSIARILTITKTKIKIADTLWSVVIGYIREVLETDLPQHGLSLFRAMVGKTILLPEMYDTMKRVNQLLVHSKIQAVRVACEQIISTFILTYPLQSKRLDQQLEFVMANLTYKEGSGRLAIIHLLKSLFTRFPEALLNQHMQYFFLPLVAQMINDDFAENRAASASAIETLYSRVSTDKASELFQLAMQWYEDDEGKVSLQRAAAQLLMLFAGKLGGESFAPFVMRLLPTMLKRLRSVTSDYEEDDMESLVHVTDDQWQAVYFTLLLIEKCATLVDSSILKSSFVPIWKEVSSPQLLEFPHPWVKLVCARLLGLYFAARKEKMPLKLPKKGESSPDWIVEPRRLFSMAKHFCNMLSAPDLSEELGTQVVKNLYWLTLQLQAFPELTPQAQIIASSLQGDDQIDSANEDSDEEEETKKTVEPELDDALDASSSDMDVGEHDDTSNGRSKAMEPSTSKSKGTMVDERANDQGGVPAVAWVFRRLSYMAKSLNRLGKSCVFKFFAAMTVAMSADEIKRYLVFMLFPLFRANEAIISREAIQRSSVHGPRPESPESIEFTELVHQVAELLRKKVGTTPYYEGHEKVRARVMEVRQKRKSELAIDAVVNPAKSALRKAARSEKKKQAKKRKIEAHMAHRTTHRIKMRKTHE